MKMENVTGSITASSDHIIIIIIAVRGMTAYSRGEKTEDFGGWDKKAHACFILSVQRSDIFAVIEEG